MPVTPPLTYPGVYVQEVPSGVRTIVGVSTSVGMFIGTSAKGPIGRPQRCTNFTRFSDTFGDDSAAGQLSNYARLFFLNGGTDCWALRIANGATAATVTLRTEANLNTLRLDAKELGVGGENIRALVTYSGPQPEATFNITLFRWEINGGQRMRRDVEEFRGLTMNPVAPNYAAPFITQNSKLVDATDLNAAPGPGTALGFSLSGRPVTIAAPLSGQWTPLLGSTATTNLFRISIRGSEYVDVDLSTFVIPGAITIDNFLNGIGTAIQNAFVARGINTIIHTPSPAGPGGNFSVRFVDAASAPAGNVRRLQIACTNANGDVFIRPGIPRGAQSDLASVLMLGTEQGGLEVSGFASRRPAPTGITFNPTAVNVYTAFAGKPQTDLTSISLESIQSNGIPALRVIPLQPGLITNPPGTNPVSEDNYPVSPSGNSDGVRQKLQLIANAINDFVPPPGDTWPWKADVWNYRLAVIPKDSAADNFLSAGFAFTVVAPALPGTPFTNNVHLDSVGAGGASTGLQVNPGLPASDGTPPALADYRAAFLRIDKDVDLFNLMVLAPDAAIPIEQVYGEASVFCQQRRAFLIMDPPTSAAASWDDAQDAATSIPALRVGLVRDYSAVYYPRVIIDDKGVRKPIGAAGGLAGVYARTDSTRGVWKAPAGTEADLRGIVGLEQALSDGENGIINPRAINALRVFPSGIVSWGARTNMGDDNTPDDYKYIPVRRLALFIEESLYRGLKWVVFEPNDEPLWAQIRLNVGAFMHNLFRQGAFQGATPRVSYFVKCDGETTTQNDRNLGIVNIWVGFAPLKPAEFVILYLQQMAGQIET